ncbi:hypothetical protein HOD71_01595 [Candidatus Peribacteria bacterium]|nr:hypothetical protein [Candidatus Peribacteria bacterium]
MINKVNTNEAFTSVSPVEKEASWNRGDCFTCNTHPTEVDIHLQRLEALVSATTSGVGCGTSDSSGCVIDEGITDVNGLSDKDLSGIDDVFSRHEEELGDDLESLLVNTHAEIDSSISNDRSANAQPKLHDSNEQQFFAYQPDPDMETAGYEKDILSSGESVFHTVEELDRI